MLDDECSSAHLIIDSEKEVAGVFSCAPVPESSLGVCTAAEMGD
jgi:hypothetical protein